jgi:Winged helix-turn helix
VLWTDCQWQAPPKDLPPKSLFPSMLTDLLRRGLRLVNVFATCGGGERSGRLRIVWRHVAKTRPGPTANCAPAPDQHAHLTAMMRGHYAYYGITGNARRLSWYARQVARIWQKWLSRRGHAMDRRYRALLYDAGEKGRACDLIMRLHEEFGLSVSDDTIYRVLKTLGFSHVSARPKAYRQNAEAMGAFKKTSPSVWRKSVRSSHPTHR